MKKTTIPSLEIRYTKLGDRKYLKKWLLDEKIARWFPFAIDDPEEIAMRTEGWIGWYRDRCSLTAVVDGVPCGIATLQIVRVSKLKHQCEFMIIVGTKYQGLGIGTKLLKSLMQLAKKQFKIKLLHLHVYMGNPAISLYKKLGFREYGRQQYFAEDKGVPIGRILMEKKL